MSNRISRRHFGQLLAAGASVGALGRFTTAAWADTRLRLIWWGNPDRDRRTEEVVDLYKTKRPDVTIDIERYAWTDYWPKLATQAAGKNLPDVIQMDYRYIFEYARRGQLAELDPFLGKEIKIDGYDPNLLESGKVDGKLYGISNGGNSIAIVYNKTKFDELGVTLPDPTKWTYADFIALGKDLKGKLPEGVWFAANHGEQEPWLDNWVRQRGKALYTADGQLGYDLEDLESFWQFWWQMQEDGLTPPPDVQAQDSGSIDLAMIVHGKTVTDYCNSNQLVAIQKLVEDTVDLTMMPNQEGNRPGHYLKPSMFFSTSAGSAAPQEAAAFLNFFIADPEAANILSIERGVPGLPQIRETISPILTETERQILNYLDVVATHVGPIPPPPPTRAGELDRAIRPAWQAIAFGKVSVKDGAAAFYKQAVDTLKRQ